MNDPALGDAQESAACPVCHAPVFPGNNFCEACGHRIAEPPSATEASAGEPATTELPETAPCTGCGATGIDADGYCEQCGLRQPGGRDHVEVELTAEGRVIAAGVSDKGLRHSKNEDAMALAATRGGVAGVVCDGVSSSPRPEDASRAAADTGVAVLLKELESGADAETATRTAVLQAAQAVAALAASEHDAPACTYVSALTAAESITVGWVGDSRAYWLPAPTAEPSARPVLDLATTADLVIGDGLVDSAEATRLTQDDSWAEQMVALGALTEAEAQSHRNAHVLVGWLGADAQTVRAHVQTFAPGRPGVVVVCSDGLWNYLPEASAISEALAEELPGPPPGVAAAAADPLAAARSLVGIALDSGGRDNITVLVIPFSPTDLAGPVEPPAHPSTEPAE